MSSSSGDEDFMVAYLALEYMGSFDHNTKRPRRTPVQSGIQWVERQLENESDCYDMFRMRRSVFNLLHDILVSQYGLTASRGICTREALGMFLWTCGAPQSFRQVKNKFGHSLETVSRKFGEVLECVNRMAVDIIRPRDPLFGTVHAKLQEPRFWPHFNDCIGAIDGTHIPVTVPLSEQPKYFGRHGYASQNVMAVCDFDMRFTFAVTGWAGSVHDARVLLDTLVTYKDEFPFPPEGKYYLVDSGYPNKKGFLAPYKGQRYHVSEWQHGHHPSGPKELFNYVHSSLRNVIERSFGVLKMKWRILLNLPAYPILKQSKIITACMALHNFVREHGVEDIDFGTSMPQTEVLHNESSTGEGSISIDDIDMGAFRDAIASALSS